MSVQATNIIESVSLHCQEGSSDKVYHIQLVETEGGYVVNFQYGARGSTLKDGTKTSSPVALDQARKVFDALLSEKVNRKQYRVTHRAGQGEGAEAPAATSLKDRPESAGFKPQLLNAIDEATVERLIEDDDYCAQQKVDGVRMLVRVTGHEVYGSNKLSQGIAVPREVEEELLLTAGAQQSMAGLGLDGEYAQSVLYVFDVLELRGESTDQMTYHERSYLIDMLALETEGVKAVKFLPTARTTAEKRELYDRLQREQKEGIVFKLKDGKHKPGRPHSGGDHLKFQFRKSVDCIVTASKNGRRSLECWVYYTGELADIGVFAEGELVSIGRCASGVTQAIFDRVKRAEEAGTPEVAEVQYLYATASLDLGGSLYQPVYKRQRTDKPASACLASQLVTTSKAV